MHTTEVLFLVYHERIRQEGLKASGRFEHTAADSGCSDLARLAMLTEEIGEVARALQRAAHDPEQDLRSELIQCAAICCAWVESLGDAA